MSLDTQPELPGAKAREADAVIRLGWPSGSEALVATDDEVISVDANVHPSGHVALEHDPAPQTPQVIQGILWLASRTQGGTDPVVVNGDLALLIPEFQYSFDIFLDKGAPKGPADFSLQIPNDPVLQGLVMLFQYVAIAPNASQDTVVSDVFGSTILPAPSGGGSYASETGPRAPTWAKMTAKRRAEARKAFGQWLTRDKGSISPSGAQLIAAVQARLVRQHKKR